MRAIAVLASGGDAPGMNACIRAVTRAALDRGAQVWGVQDGYQGLIDHRMNPLLSRGVAGILQRGGSILGAGRCQDFLFPEARIRCVDYLREQGIEGLVVIGGDGSLTGVRELHKLGFAVVGVPGTIDNDVPGTDMCIGTDTAVNTAVEAIDRLRDTASAHNRAMIVEVMGRNSGYLASMAGLAAGAEMVITPEHPTSLEEVFQEMQLVESRGKRHFIVVLSEGATWSAPDLCQRINDADIAYDARFTVLGYIQRGGSPTAGDRILATQMGVVAVDRLWACESNVLVAQQNGKILSVSLEKLPLAGGAKSDAVVRAQTITAT